MKIPKELRLDEVQTGIWYQRIVRSWRSKSDHVRKWEKVREYYQGNFFATYSDMDRVSADWLFVAVRQMIAALYSQDPAMNFHPRTVKGQYAAEIMQKVVPYVRRLISACEEERRALQNALLYGTGILKFAWNAEFGEDTPWAGKPIKDKAILANAHGGYAEAVAEGVALPQGPMTEHNTRVVAGMPVMRSVSPFHFLVDPDATEYHAAEWVAHRFYRKWLDAVRDERWDDEARKQLDRTGASAFHESLDSPDTAANWRDDPEEADTAMSAFYEIWHKPTRTIVVISPSCPTPLSVRQYPYAGKDGPYRVLQFFPTDETFWAIPYADTFVPQVEALNKVRDQFMDHLQRHGVTKTVVQQGRMSPEDIERYAKAVNQVVELRYTGDDINKVIQTMPYMPIAADAWNLQGLFKSDYQEVSGVSEMALGSGRGVQTATEANFIQQQSGLRVTDMRGQVDNFLRESTRAIVALLRQFWRGSHVVPIIGPHGQMYDQVITPGIVNGEYDADIEPGSTERFDRAARARQGLELIRELIQLQPLAQQQGRQIDVMDVLMQVLRNSDIIKSPERVLKTLPPQQPAMAPPGGNGQVPPRALANVNQLGQMMGTGETFEGQRALSEGARN